MREGRNENELADAEDDAPDPVARPPRSQIAVTTIIKASRRRKTDPAKQASRIEMPDM